SAAGSNGWWQKLISRIPGSGCCLCEQLRFWCTPAHVQHSAVATSSPGNPSGPSTGRTVFLARELGGDPGGLPVAPPQGLRLDWRAEEAMRKRRLLWLGIAGGTGLLACAGWMVIA